MDINTALASSKDAIEQLLLADERSGPAWTAARAPGKWSPSHHTRHHGKQMADRQ